MNEDEHTLNDTDSQKLKAYRKTLSLVPLIHQQSCYKHICGLFDRASSSWNKAKCQLDAAR